MKLFLWFYTCISTINNKPIYYIGTYCSNILILCLTLLWVTNIGAFWGKNVFWIAEFFELTHTL